MLRISKTESSFSPPASREWFILRYNYLWYYDNQRYSRERERKAIDKRLKFSSHNRLICVSRCVSFFSSCMIRRVDQHASFASATNMESQQPRDSCFIISRHFHPASIFASFHSSRKFFFQLDFILWATKTIRLTARLGLSTLLVSGICCFNSKRIYGNVWKDIFAIRESSVIPTGISSFNQD